jgi:outer membrane biosynthesis protein TonB
LISGITDQLAELTPQHDKLRKEYISIHDRLVFCENSPPTHEPQPQPPQPTPEEDQDIPVEESPSEDIPVEEPAPEKPEPTPPSEEQPKKVYGLACRIQDLKAPGLAQHLRELKQLAQAQQQKLVQAKTDLQQWQTAIAAMKIKNEGTAAERAAEFTKFKQAHDQFLLKSARYGFDSLDYMMETEECPDRLKIKIEQVRTRYN